MKQFVQPHNPVDRTVLVQYVGQTWIIKFQIKGEVAADVKINGAGAHLIGVVVSNWVLTALVSQESDLRSGSEENGDWKEV